MHISPIFVVYEGFWSIKQFIQQSTEFGPSLSTAQLSALIATFYEERSARKSLCTQGAPHR
jgi:hypothetical protein